MESAKIAGIAGPSFPPKVAVQAFHDLKTEGLVTWQGYRLYAAPAGPPDPAAGARLGTTLATLRRAAGRTPDDLSARRYWTGDIREAENEAWQPREFWEAMDDRLGADGTLLRLHDHA